MVLILDGNSEIGAHGTLNHCYSNCFKTYDYMKAGANQSKDFLSLMRAQHVLSYHLIKVPWSRLLRLQVFFIQLLNPHSSPVSEWFWDLELVNPDPTRMSAAAANPKRSWKLQEFVAHVGQVVHVIFNALHLWTKNLILLRRRYFSQYVLFEWSHHTSITVFRSEASLWTWLSFTYSRSHSVTGVPSFLIFTYCLTIPIALDRFFLE